MPLITVYPTITAYPNPFLTEIHISSTTKLTAVTITDGAGRLVATLKGLPEGLLWRWKGADNNGQLAASGF